MVRNKLYKFLTGWNYNTWELDKKRCQRCGKISPIKVIKKGKKIIVDRSGRVDCDAGTGGRSYLVTYCKECWFAEVEGR